MCIFLYIYVLIMYPLVGHKLHENMDVFLLLVISSGLQTVPET